MGAVTPRGLREQEERTVFTGTPGAAGAGPAGTQVREDPRPLPGGVSVGINTSFPSCPLASCLCLSQVKANRKAEGKGACVIQSTDAGLPGTGSGLSDEDGDGVGGRGERITCLCSPLMTEGPSSALSPWQSTRARNPPLKGVKHFGNTTEVVRRWRRALLHSAELLTNPRPIWQDCPAGCLQSA